MDGEAKMSMRLQRLLVHFGLLVHDRMQAIKILPRNSG